MPLFIVDSNFFIQSHRAIYPLDVAKGFWEKVKKLADDGKIISIDKVEDEINENEDELKIWIDKNLPKQFYKPTEIPEVLVHYADVVRWASSKSSFYLAKALNEFLEHKCADAWLVVYALSLNKNGIIVTQEKSEPNRKSKIKIPEACNAFNIQCMNTIEMFREIGETF